MRYSFRICAALAACMAMISCRCEGAGTQHRIPETADAAGDAPLVGNVEQADAPRGENVEDIVEFDRTIHNFGDVMLGDGPLSCTFTMKNISEKPVVIYNVVTSCGCTDVKWTREPIMPGKTGTISSTYTNDEGPYPFDKTLTAYISGIGKPVILRLRGIAHEKQLSLEELYPARILQTGMKDLGLKCGNLEQGGQRSDETNIANLSSSPVEVTFSNVSRGLSLSVTPNPIPARSVARLQFTVSAQKDIWGKNLYHATPVIDGKSSGQELSVYAFTKDSFSGMTAAQRAEGARPIFSNNTCSSGKIRKGDTVTGEFTFSNVGKADFLIHKADVDWPGASAILPASVKSGCKGTVKITVDTSGMPEGEMIVMATLTTNSPSRPVVNLYITGTIVE